MNNQPPARVSPWGLISTWALLLVCGSASIAANWAGAQPRFLAQVFAAAPPAVYLVAVEVLLRTEIPKTFRYTGVQYIGLIAIALISAYASYVHQVKLLLSFGEPPEIAHSLPIALDGAMLLASVTLLGIAAKKRADAGTAASGKRHVCRQFLGMPVMPASGKPPTLPASGKRQTTDELVFAAVQPNGKPASAGTLVPAGAANLLEYVPASGKDLAGKRQAASGKDAGTDQRQAANEFVRQRHEKSLPITGKTVGDEFGMSERWGRDRIKEAMASA